MGRSARRGMLFLSVSNPADKNHPDYRPDKVDSVMRIDLKTLGELP